MSTVRHSNLIAGQWRESESAEWLEVRNPADEREVVAEVPAMSASEIREVYDAAHRAGVAWSATSPVARGRILLAAAALLRERQAEIATALTLEMGKTVAEATGEVGKSADFLEYCGGLGRAVQGEVLSDERPGVRVWTEHEPLGVVLAICPWNDPLLTPARKVGPALIAGNAVVLKPATLTPLVSLHLARALADAGLPEGVISTVTGLGREISGPLLSDPALAAVSFTGSNEVGNRLAADLASSGVKLQAELGGKNASVVLADADLAKAVATIGAAGFAQAGQRCTATSRVIVEAPIAEEFSERLAAYARALRLGAGVDPETTLGPVASPAQLSEVSGFVDRARESGVTVVTGGRPVKAEGLEHGNFYGATVLNEVSGDAEIWTEEVFGPVIAIRTADDLDSAISAVNASRYGLAAAVFTRDLSRATAFWQRVETGQVSVNLPTSGWDVHLPFGGFKQSGSGSKEQGLEGVAWYTRTKTIAVG